MLYPACAANGSARRDARPCLVNLVYDKARKQPTIMPVSLAQLVSNRATLAIPLAADDPDGPALHITYRPSGITPRALRAMRVLQSQDVATLSEADQLAALDTVTGYLASVLVDWDLTDNDGTPIPPTRAGLEDVDYETQAFLLRHLQEHQSLGKTSGTPRSTPSS